MKTSLIIAAATLFAGTAAFAQTTTAPSGTTDTMSAPSSTAPSASTDPSTGATGAMNPSDSAMAPTKGPDGKWMMGDRPATKAEIAAAKKSSKTKPM